MFYEKVGKMCEWDGNISQIFICEFKKECILWSKIKMRQI